MNFNENFSRGSVEKINVDFLKGFISITYRITRIFKEHFSKNYLSNKHRFFRERLLWTFEAINCDICFTFCQGLSENSWIFFRDFFKPYFFKKYTWRIFKKKNNKFRLAKRTFFQGLLQEAPSILIFLKIFSFVVDMDFPWTSKDFL